MWSHLLSEEGLKKQKTKKADELLKAAVGKQPLTAVCGVLEAEFRTRIKFNFKTTNLGGLEELQWAESQKYRKTVK